MNELNWIEKELCRRYIIGALLHVNKDLHTDGWRDRGIIDASNIFINRLIELATVYELESGEHITTVGEWLDDQKKVDKLLDDALGVVCRICRREVGHPDHDVCIRCTMQKDEHNRLDIVHNLVDNLLDTQNSQDRDDNKDRR